MSIWIGEPFVNGKHFVTTVALICAIKSCFWNIVIRKMGIVSIVSKRNLKDPVKGLQNFKNIFSRFSGLFVKNGHIKGGRHEKREEDPLFCLRLSLI